MAGHITIDQAYDLTIGQQNISHTDLNNLVNKAELDVSKFTTETTTDGATDYVIVYDASASSWRTVLLNNLPETEPYWTVTTQTGTTYAVPGTNYFVRGNNTGTLTISLPTASGEAGKRIAVKSVNTGSIVIDGNSTETIDGKETYSFTGIYEAILLVSDGNNWNIVSRVLSPDVSIASRVVFDGTGSNGVTSVDYEIGNTHGVYKNENGSYSVTLSDAMSNAYYHVDVELGYVSPSSQVGWTIQNKTNSGFTLIIDGDSGAGTASSYIGIKITGRKA